ncbi:MAG: site-2 protease family protein [Ardenticatenia bacterium]|nr:site-2 protease family protein [Ardenticatenia bacterium]
MRWSLKLGRFLGVDVYIHATFLLLLAFVAISAGMDEGQSVPVALGFVVALFGCVILHEYGHALTARRYGIGTADITLYPIGGVARLERMPEKPGQELVVALAGPAVNLAIAAGLWLLLLLLARPAVSLSQMGLLEGPLLERLLGVNLSLALFNLLPAFPMDGGRVLRALLSLRMGRERATRMAASLGQSIALLFGLAGLFGQPMLLFIAFFVWIAAGQEAAAVTRRSLLDGITVRQAMLTDFRVLDAEDSLDQAVALILAGSQQDFPVLEGQRLEGQPLDGQRVVGLLTRDQVIHALSKPEPRPAVGALMHCDLPDLGADLPLEEALGLIQARALLSVPILAEGRLVGLLTMDNVAELLMVRGTLRAGRGG